MAGTWIDLPAAGGGSGSAYWKDAVLTVGALPTGGADGEVRMVLATHELYYWNQGNGQWELVPTSQIDPSDVVDTDSVDLTVTGGILSADVRLSTDPADAGYIESEIAIASGASPGLRAQIADSLIRGLFSAGDQYLSYDSGAGEFSLVVSEVLGLFTSTTNAIDYDDTTGEFTFVPGNVDHGDLADLGADTHPQYALLAGRSGGQTLSGGDTAGDALVLQSTSDTTKGVIQLVDPVQMPVLSTADIAGLTPTAGLMVYDSDLDRPVMYIAGTTNAWVQMMGWGNP